MTKTHKTVDARGLSCPMPIVKSMQAIKKIRIGQVLEILTRARAKDASASLKKTLRVKYVKSIPTNVLVKSDEYTIA